MQSPLVVVLLAGGRHLSRALFHTKSRGYVNPPEYSLNAGGAPLVDSLGRIAFAGLFPMMTVMG